MKIYDDNNNYKNNNNSYWLILIILFVVSIGLNIILNHKNGGDKNGLIVILCFFGLAIFLSLILPSVRIFPFII